MKKKASSEHFPHSDYHPPPGGRFSISDDKTYQVSQTKTHPDGQTGRSKRKGNGPLEQGKGKKKQLYAKVLKQRTGQREGGARSQVLGEKTPSKKKKKGSVG